MHGYIGYSATRPPDPAEYGAGMGFYSVVWPLIDQPLARFQIGLAGTWITPDNSDNKDKPLAPVGTHARDHWPERGPTYSSVFQTLEGGLGYWARNHFRYGPPKFSMNATPQCYDYEVGSPGWSFFYDNEALPDNRLGIAQLMARAIRGQSLARTLMMMPMMFAPILVGFQFKWFFSAQVGLVNNILYTLTGEGLTVSKAAGTMMACAPALMQQESLFLDVLQNVRRFDLASDGALILQTDDRRTITARR